MATRIPFGVDEWYHCYNRGVDKRKIFMETHDYDRFLLLLYAANDTRSTRIRDRDGISIDEFIAGAANDRTPIVEIGAYALMPNHFHLILKEITEGGISLFMQRVMTGFTMYFNRKNDRTGALMASTFKSRRLHDDEYLKHAVAYVHMNPIDLFEPRWKEGRGDLQIIEQKLREYRYSSLVDFHDITNRPRKKILSNSLRDLYEKSPDIAEVLKDAHEYYVECGEV